MGLFNNLMIDTASGPVEVQFKWGWVELLDYRVGDTVKWFDFPKPDRTKGLLEISGIAADHPEDPNAKAFSYYKIVIENDVITRCERVPEAEWLSIKDPGFRD
jgi:hypothetical protein